MSRRNELEILRDIIARETLYLRHYDGKVLSNSDPLNLGRVLVAIPMLGWNSQAQAAWARPRGLHSLSVPSVGEYVEVYFLDGDPSRAVYLGNATHLQGQIPQGYDGNVQHHVLFQDPASGFSIILKAESGELDIGGSSKSLVTYDALNSALQALVTYINAHVHSGVTTGPGSSGPPGPTSLDISAAKSASAKVGS